MKKFDNKEISTYYNHTLTQYQVGWQLNRSKGLHFGIWYDDTKDLHQAIINANLKVGEHLNGRSNLHVLDAGCGIGGTAMFLAQQFNCTAEGITLSNKQIMLGESFIKEANLQEKVRLSNQDFAKTEFKDESFDVVYYIESLCHASDKKQVLKEAFRVLKPGGVVVTLDYFKTKKGELPESRKLLEWWLHRWAVEDIDTWNESEENLIDAGFINVVHEDLTKEIRRTVKTLNRKAMLGLLTIPLYTIIYPNKYIYSRRHPESGWALNACYKKGLMGYQHIYATKPA